MTAHPDFEWLGLVDAGPNRYSLEVTPRLTRLDAKFYGGTGAAVVAAVMEAATRRSALWETVQFVSSADIGERLDCVVDVLASGRRTSQVQVTGRAGDRTVFVAIGSAGERRDGVLDAQFGAMPDVGGPDDAEPFERRMPFRRLEGHRGWLDLIDMRVLDLPGGRMAMWARLRDRPLTRAALGFLTDVVPMSVVRAAGRAGAGTSLDNTVRFGPDPAGEWVLVDPDPHLAAGGYVHGAARVWTPAGTLLAVASQTAATVLFD